MLFRRIPILANQIVGIPMAWETDTGRRREQFVGSVLQVTIEHEHRSNCNQNGNRHGRQKHTHANPPAGGGFSWYAIVCFVHATYLSVLVTDRAMEAWYHPSIALMTPRREVTRQATSDDENS